MFQESEGKWTLIIGETDHVECKQNFQLRPENRFADIIKAIAGLANSKGRYIFFGVRNVDFCVDGLASDLFKSTDPAEINRILASALDPVPHVAKTMVELGGKAIGVLFIEKHQNPPIIALKNIASDVREGSIYFRYVGETRLIKPGELRRLIADREQQAIAEFTRRISNVASGSAATIDLDTGEVAGRTGSFVIDQKLLPDIQFIREGDFSERRGAPALRLIGDVEPVSKEEKERVRIIRESVTPDAVVRNFLLGEAVADPVQYIHAQAHFQRRWLPVWYYVKQARAKPELLVEELRDRVASHPSSRDALAKRLRREQSALSKMVGRPAQICKNICDGVINAPADISDDMAFATAVTGLPDSFGNAEQLKPILLTCLDRAQGGDAKSGSRRSAISRAACRLDELLHGSRD